MRVHIYMCTCETKACSLRQCQHCTTNKSASSTRMNQSPQKNRAGREQALPTRCSLQKGEEQLKRKRSQQLCLRPPQRLPAQHSAQSPPRFSTNTTGTTCRCSCQLSCFPGVAALACLPVQCARVSALSTDTHMPFRCRLPCSCPLSHANVYVHADSTGPKCVHRESWQKR